MSDGLSDKTKKELVDIAKDLKIKNYSKLSKDDLVKSIRKYNAKKEQLNIVSDVQKDSTDNSITEKPKEQDIKNSKDEKSTLIESNSNQNNKSDTEEIKTNNLYKNDTKSDNESISISFTNSDIKTNYTEQVDLIDLPSPPPSVKNYDSFSEGYIPKKASYDFTER